MSNTVSDSETETETRTEFETGTGSDERSSATTTVGETTEKSAPSGLTTGSTARQN
jgi:hypothetical protein